MRRQVKFVDHFLPAEYVWPINYLTEEGSGRGRSIEPSAPTGVGAPLLFQQGAESPQTRTLQGTILDPAQHQAFVDWYERCASHTIEFWDIDGSRHEVQITRFSDPKTRVFFNPRGKGTWLENAKIEYTMELLIYRTLTGPWAGVVA